MEHLLHEVEAPDEVKFAFGTDVLWTDWECGHQPPSFVEPRTVWMNFDHDVMPLCSFLEYPTAADFDQEHLWNATLEESYKEGKTATGSEIGEQVAALVQAWCFHGLLASILHKKVRVSYLVRQAEDGKQCLYTRNLHLCLQALVFSLRLASAEEKLSASARIQTELKHLQTWLARFVDWSHPSFRPQLEIRYPGFMGKLEATIPAIVRLAEAVEQARLFALPNAPTNGTLSYLYPFKLVEARRLLLGSLGWCPFQIRMLEDTLNQSTVDWIITVQMRQDPTGHQTCTRKACARNNVDEDAYQQAHVCRDGDCSKVMPDIAYVVDALKADHIPLLESHAEGSEARLAISTTPKEDSEVYVAISHVWADGLGGKAERGLNECQVTRLQRLCQELLPSVSRVRFWIDSLCIPGPEVDEHAYMKALVGIKHVYRNASAVLVLDATIAQCTTFASTEVLYAHIYLSAWMQRMWTYEEAVLAKKLVFRLQDGFHHYLTTTQPTARRTVSLVWQSLASELFRLRTPPDFVNIGHVYHAFRYRLTNASQGEFLSVSGILNLDTELILRAEGDDRTRQFWLSLRWLPFNIPFLDGPKLHTPGFRWAPRTMMWPSQTRLDTEVAGAKCECTASGLVAEYSMISLSDSVKGSASGRGAVSNVWVGGGRGGSRDQANDLTSSALVRIFCFESWATALEPRRFDTVLLHSEHNTFPEQGQKLTGVALLREKDSAAGQEISQDGDGNVTKAQYVGRVLVERLQVGEWSKTKKTVMFEGSSMVVVDANGTWCVQKICVT
jgi:hypothetical protein